MAFDRGFFSTASKKIKAYGKKNWYPQTSIAANFIHESIEWKVGGTSQRKRSKINEIMQIANIL